ncbi:MAG: amidase family protein [Variovorax sp.]
MTLAPPLVRVIAVDFFDSPYRLRLPFRFGAVTITQGLQAIVRVRLRHADGRVGEGYAADALAAKWFDKSPLLSDDQNVDQLRAALGLARDAYLAAPPSTCFDLYAAHDRSLVDSGAALQLEPLVTHYGPALLDRAVLDALCRIEGLSFAQAMRANLAGMHAHPIIADLPDFDFGAFLRTLTPQDRLSVRHTVGLLDPITAADQAPGQRVDDGLPETLEEVAATYGNRYFKIKVSGQNAYDLDRLRRIAAALDSIPDPIHITLDGNEQYADADAMVELWQAMAAEPALRRLCSATLLIEQPVTRRTALAQPVDALARLRPVIIDESDGALDAFPRAKALGYRRVVQGLQGLLQVAHQPGAMPRVERSNPGPALLHVGRGPHDAGRPVAAAGSGAGQPAGHRPCGAQRAPFHQWLQWPAEHRGRCLPARASRPLPPAGPAGAATRRPWPTLDGFVAGAGLRFRRGAGPVANCGDARGLLAVDGITMSFTDYEKHDGLGLAALVRAGELSAAELLEAALARIAARNPALNAVVTPMTQAARDEVARGVLAGQFQGVPFLVKELVAAVAGTATTSASRLYAGQMAGADSEIVARCRRAGLVIAGKTNSPEFGLSPMTESLLYGVTRNPWDLTLSPGGSSGGAAAAVAAGMVPLAHATDGGGSIRIPASCCGLFGLKPTRARSSAGPDGGEGLSGLANQHVVSRSVRDSAALLDAIAGPLPGDPYQAPAPIRPYLDEIHRDPVRLRIGFAHRAPTGGPVDAECRAAVEDAARLCASLGHEVEEASPDFDAQAVARGFAQVFAANTTANIARQTGGAMPGADQVEPLTLALAERGRSLSASDHILNLHALHRQSRRIAAFFERYDIWLTPTLTQTPRPHGWFDIRSSDVDTWLARLNDYLPFTYPFNVTGQPAASVPLYWTEGGVPIGCQIAARYGDEGLLLALAAQLEHARPWFHRRPPGFADTD